MTRKPLTQEELTVEACLWAMEGLAPNRIATVLRVSRHDVDAALRRSGGWFVTLPGRGRRKRQVYWFLPEADRVRIGASYYRAVLTGARRIYWGGINPTRPVGEGDPNLTAWERQVWE